MLLIFFFCHSSCAFKSYLFAGGKNQLGDLLLVTAVKEMGFLLMEILEVRVSILNERMLKVVD